MRLLLWCRVNQESPKRDFVRRSETESICLLCYLTVRADPWNELEEAENIHLDVCSVQPDYPTP